MLCKRIVDLRLLVRRLTVIADDVATPEELAAGKRYEQLDLFGDVTGPNRLWIADSWRKDGYDISVRCWM